MATDSRNRIQFWGPLGVTAALLIAGITFLLSAEPKSADVVAFVMFGLGGMVLLGSAAYAVYKSYRALRGDVESTRRSHEALKEVVESIRDVVKTGVVPGGAEKCRGMSSPNWFAISMPRFFSSSSFPTSWWG